MIRSYLKIALRNLWRQKGYSIMNIFGLAIGMAACLFILLFVLDELSYDRFHEKAERIYRINFVLPEFGGTAALPTSTGPVFKGMYPEIQAMVRLLKQPTILRTEDALGKEERFFYVDSTFFRIFDFPLRYGDPATVLSQPNALVITRSTAERYFGTTEVLGRTLETNRGEVFQITGVAEDPPGNSHVRFDFLASYQTLGAVRDPATRWASTYVLLSGEPAMENLQKKLNAFTAQDPEKMNQTVRYWLQNMSFRLQSLTSIHLHPQAGAEPEPGGDPRYLYLYSGIAVFILLIATVNYMNLATARSMGRAREVGVRKIVGAQNNQLAGQFLIESLLFAVLAMVLAFLLAELGMPVFSALTGKTHIGRWLHAPLLLIAFGGFTVITGLLAGSYPAYFLSRFGPLRVLTFLSSHQAAGRVFRKGLVVFQFTISIALITGTLAMHAQLRYIQQKRLGFDREHILILPMQGTLKQHYRPFRQELKRLTGVQHVSVAMGPPTMGFQGPIQWEDHTYIVQNLSVDAEYVKTMGLEIVQGRDFSPGRPADSIGILVNETAARLFGFLGKIGERVDPSFIPGNEPHTLLGIVRDFQNTSFYEPILPAFLYIAPGMLRDNLLLRLQPGARQQTLPAIHDLWRQFVPDYPFEYHFLTEDLNSQYRPERRMATLFNYFSGLAIFIACLGLFGLAAYTAEQRTKEIGIRKVLGATGSNILVLLSKEFIILVMLVAIIAFPITFLIMRHWLQEFAYRTSIGAGLFVTAGVGVILIALISVSSQALKAALTNPTETLRYE